MEVYRHVLHVWVCVCVRACVFYDFTTTNIYYLTASVNQAFRSSLAGGFGYKLSNEGTDKTLVWAAVT